MKLDLNNLCMGCMQDKGRGATCPYCGYDEDQYDKNYIALAPRTILNGQYIIGKVLGEPGGFGITYIAFDANLYKRVAVKEYFPSGYVSRSHEDGSVILNESKNYENFDLGIKKFMQEAQTLAKFNNPYIVKVLNFFQENQTGYLVMDYYEGITLKEYFKQHLGKIPMDDAMQIIIPVMDGMREVHEKNILHRDIKPENIYIRNDGLPVLLDFGAARIALDNNSKSVLLTPGFAPIEQYTRNGHQGTWSDVYAVAATFYYIVSGKEVLEATDRVIKDDIVALEELGFSKQISDPVMKALSMNPEDRFVTMEGFQNAILGSEISSEKSTTNKEKKTIYNKKVENKSKEKKKLISLKSIISFSLIGIGTILSIFFISNLFLGKNGKISVISKTQGELFIDDKSYGVLLPENNTEIAKITPGVHSIKIKYNEKEELKSIDIKAKELKKISFDWIKIENEMIFVSGGKFKMGNLFNDGKSNEVPSFDVTLNDFYMSKFEVSIQEFKEFVTNSNYITSSEEGKGSYIYNEGWVLEKSGNWKNPYFIQEEDHPVVCISWWDAIKYCNWKNKIENLPKAYNESTGELLDEKGNTTYDITKVFGYRLPTEAEWEYAASEGGERIRFSSGKDIADPKELNFNGKQKTEFSNFGKYRKSTVSVFSFLPNKLGIYNLSGNVAEWCTDWYTKYNSESKNNPYVSERSRVKIERGGHWEDSAIGIRIYARGRHSREYSDSGIGMRLVKSK